MRYLKNKSRFWKIALMNPRDDAGSSVGSGKYANRKGGKIRGKKGGGKQKNKKVNISKLIEKTNKAAG